MNTTPDYHLMFLKVERDMAELDRNNAQRKLSECKALKNRLAFLQAPESERICADLQKVAMEREVQKRIDILEDLRAQVGEAEVELERRQAEELRVQSGH